MIKVALLGDLHFKKKNIRSRNDDIEVVIRDKFKQIRDIIKEEDVSHVFSTGDTFCKALVSKEIFWFAHEMISSLGVDCTFSVGNHELHSNVLRNYKMSDIYFLQSETKNLSIIVGDNPYKDYGDNLRVYFNHYGDDNFIKEDLDSSKYNVALSHSTITNGYEMFNSIDANKINTNLDKIWNGHFHIQYDTEKVCNVGSLLRLSSEDRDMKQIPRVVIITIDENGATYDSRYLNVANYKECFDVKTVNNKQAQLDDVMKEKLNSAMTGVSDTKEIASILAKEDKTEDEVLKCFNKYVGDKNED